MAIQTASFFLLMGSAILIKPTQRGLLGHLLDALGMTLVMLTLMLIAGYTFGAPRLYLQDAYSLTPPQTMVCIALLAFVQVGRRAPYGFFSELVGASLGGQFMRMLLPFVLGAPFLIMGITATLFKLGWFDLPFAAAMTAASIAALMVPAVVMLARKLNKLERQLRDASLIDQMTGVYNYRGLYLLGEQAIAEARRDNKPITVIFLDVDGLKKVNDQRGHEVGSRLLVEIGELLRKSFRGSDIVGRCGGDEFAIVTRSGETELNATLQRLYAATAAANSRRDKPYRISFSVGAVTSEPPNEESFAELMNRADVAMYHCKREKYSVRRAQAEDQIDH